MDIDTLIQNTIKPIVPICVPDFYEGESTEYCVYSYIEEPIDGGDDLPETIRYIVSLQWVFPWAPLITASPEIKAKKLRIKRAMAAADFSYPLVRPASDYEAGHFIFEAVIVGGEV